MIVERVLFLCTHNSARSQMAEGLLRHLGGDGIDVASAGTEARGVHPLAVRAMAELGIELRGHTSKTLERFFPGVRRRLHWSFDDPSAAVGSDEQRLAVFRRVRDDIRARIETWLAQRRAAAGRRSA